MAVVAPATVPGAPSPAPSSRLVPVPPAATRKADIKLTDSLFAKLLEEDAGDERRS
jgi:hypothetical protein